MFTTTTEERAIENLSDVRTKVVCTVSFCDTFPSGSGRGYWLEGGELTRLLEGECYHKLTSEIFLRAMWLYRSKAYTYTILTHMVEMCHLSGLAFNDSPSHN